MKNLMMMLILIGCCTGSGLAQEDVPKELYKVINDYLYGGTSSMPHFKGHLRSLGLDTTFNMSDIVPGIPVRKYLFKAWNTKDQFDSLSTDAEVMSVIEPTAFWWVPIKLHGTYTIRVEFECKNGNCGWVESGFTGGCWAEVRNAYPESTGINPILIWGGSGYFLHFPQINKHNLTFLADSTQRAQMKRELNRLKELKNPDDYSVQETEDLLSTTTDSYHFLVDSRTTFKYFKNRIERIKKKKAISGVNK